MGPIYARAGYGDHAKDLLRSLYKMDKYDIQIIPTRWGNCPQNQIDQTDEFDRWTLQRVVTNINQKPDIFVQVSVANEFQAIGQYNIGITAGVETTVAPKDFIDGCNKMNLVIVPSKFTKQTLENTSFDEIDNSTGRVVRQIKLTTPIEVLHEGVDLEIFSKKDELKELDLIPEDFNFLIVGHWLRGDIGEDRKDISMTIKTLAGVFQYVPKEKRPGIVIKTSLAGFSYLERTTLEGRIRSLLAEYKTAPSVYFIHGELTSSQMSSLYNHKKIKALVSFTKGEGYGRPLAEFALTGKPVIASNWSGHLDFLNPNSSVLLDGITKPVHQSAIDQFLIKESSWFTVNYTNAGKKLYDIWKNYEPYLKNSQEAAKNIRTNFSMAVMDEKFKTILTENVKGIVKQMEIKLPKLKKIESSTSGADLPKLNIVK